jgi:hypothetical protein
VLPEALLPQLQPVRPVPVESRLLQDELRSWLRSRPWLRLQRRLCCPRRWRPGSRCCPDAPGPHGRPLGFGPQLSQGHSGQPRDPQVVRCSVSD